MRLSIFFETLRQDLRYAVRGLARNPIFALTAVCAAALGIGSTTAVFSVVDRILFRSLPYPDEDRLVSFGMMAPLDTNEFLLSGNYLDFRRATASFEIVTSFVAGVAGCDLTEGIAQRLGCAQVEGNFIPALGLSLFLGRNFLDAEDRPGAPRVALISHALWRDRFGRDPKISGRVISLDGQPVTVVGVLPPGFELPTLATADILVPEALDLSNLNSTRFLRTFAKLKPGITIAQARAALQPLLEHALLTVPPQIRREVSLRIRSIRDRQMHDARTASWVLLGAVIAVLLIACANVANLLLARSLNRSKEIAVRLALGARRGRLFRQALTESALLAVAGGVLGCALAWLLLRLFIGIAPAGIPHLEQAALDARVLWFALAGSLVSGLLFGLAPAFQNPNTESLTGSRSAGARRMILRESLVAIQIAASLVLLTSAGMLLRSLWKLERVPLGVNSERVITADFTLGLTRYADAARQLEFFQQLETDGRAIPGVTAAAISDTVPPSGGIRARPHWAIRAQGRPPLPPGTGGMVAWRFVTPGYFAALGIPIVQGRGFTEDDRGPGEERVIVSESLARKLYPDGDAVGKHLTMEDSHLIVGIARDVKNNGAAQPSDPEYYVLRENVLGPTYRNQEPPSGWRTAKLILRTSADPKAMSDWLVREFHTLDPELPVTVTTMHERVSKLSQRPRFNALLLSLFAAMGALLAAIGLYGVMAFLVGQRTQEIGVRMALGATPSHIARLILSRAALWTAAGSLAGLIGVLFATRALRSLLFQVSEHDSWTFAAALVALGLVALAAAWLPSRRASRADPMSALHHE